MYSYTYVLMNLQIQTLSYYSFFFFFNKKYNLLIDKTIRDTSCHGVKWIQDQDVKLLLTLEKAFFKDF